VSELGVNADARDEHVAPHRFAQGHGRRADQPRHVAARVDHGIPCATAQRAQSLDALRPIATQFLHALEQSRPRPSIEERDPMPARPRRADQLPAEDLRPTQDQEIHAPPRALPHPNPQNSPPMMSTSNAMRMLWNAVTIGAPSRSTFAVIAISPMPP